MFKTKQEVKPYAVGLTVFAVIVKLRSYDPSQGAWYAEWVVHGPCKIVKVIEPENREPSPLHIKHTGYGYLVSSHDREVEHYDIFFKWYKAADECGRRKG